MTTAELSRIVVVHSTPEWLPFSEAWIYHQLQHLPPDITSHIVCQRTANLDQFALPNLHYRDQHSVLRRALDFGLWRTGIRRYPALLPKVTREYNAHIIHSHFGNIAWTNIPAAQRTGAAHIATFYGFDVGMLPKSNPSWRRRYAKLFQHVHRVLCEGPHMAACVAELGCPADKLQVHHLGVPLDRLPYRPRVWTFPEPLRVLMAASFQEKKGITYGLRALSLLKKDIRLEITIIGDANNESRSRAEKSRILATIAETGLKSDVRLLGYQPYDVLIQQAYDHHVFLSPSVTASDGDTEGGAPVTVIEMAATGMPVVSSWHCDIPEIVRDGLTGFLAQERDVGSLYGALCRVTAEHGKWAVIQSAARQQIEQEFDARCQGVRLATIYRQVAGA